MSEYLLQVKDLHTSFFTDSGEVKAVNGVSFNLEAGKTLGIVGESGSGKSVTAYSIMQILEKNGSIKKGEKVKNESEMQKVKLKMLVRWSMKECSQFVRSMEAFNERWQQQQRPKQKIIIFTPSGSECL